jgi:hypothetical protein
VIGRGNAEVVETVVAQNDALKIEGLQHRRFFHGKVTASAAYDNLIGIVSDI